jgi:hypothetical protein
MIGINGRGGLRQYYDVDPIDHLRLNGSVQSTPDQLRHCPAQGHRAAVSIPLNLREHVIIKI